MRRHARPLLGLVVALGASQAHARATDAEPTVNVVVPDGLSDRARAALGPLQAHTRVHVVQARPDDVPSRDEILRAARRAYGAMSFPRASTALQSAERALVADHAPSSARVARLAEVEAFYGACLLLSGDARAAEERFALAKALDPAIRADAIFPPEVSAALASARPGPALSVTVEREPSDARVWIDAAPVDAVPPLAAGLHYVATEHADRKPSGAIVRVSKAVARATWTAGPVATSEQALLASADARAGDRERVAVSAALHAPLWRVVESGTMLDATRFDASDLAHPIRPVSVSALDPQELARAVCAIDACDAPVATTHAAPVWRRKWFWGVVGAGAVIVVGAVIAGAVVATSPRGYDAVVR